MYILEPSHLPPFTRDQSTLNIIQIVLSNLDYRPQVTPYTRPSHQIPKPLAAPTLIISLDNTLQVT